MYITIAVLRETQPHEQRVAMVPSVADVLINGLGAKVQIQSGAGEATDHPDSAFGHVEAIEDRISLVRHADVVLAVHAPALEVIDAMKEGAILISFIYAALDPAILQHLIARKITCFAMERIPDIPRARPMNALASQAAIAGYRSVLLGAMHLSRSLPELTTAAGVIGPARVLVLGLGVAGLEAIATAKRMGAVVEGYDGSPEIRSRASAMGVAVIDDWIQISECSGRPYELSAEEWTRVDDILTWHVHQADLIITTAAIPGHSSPRPINKKQIDGMKAGSVIVDLSADCGGNCRSSLPGDITRIGRVTIVAPLHVASQVAADASNLYAMNLYHLLALMMKDQVIAIDWNDEILAKAVISHAGEERNGGW